MAVSGVPYQHSAAVPAAAPVATQGMRWWPGGETRTGGFHVTSGSRRATETLSSPPAPNIAPAALKAATGMPLPAGLGVTWTCQVAPPSGVASAESGSPPPMTHSSPRAGPLTAMPSPHGTVCTGAGLQVRPVSVEVRSEEHTSELQSRLHLVCRL